MGNSTKGYMPTRAIMLERVILLEKFYNALEQPIICTTKEGIIVYGNHATEKITGLTTKDIQNKPVWDFLPSVENLLNSSGFKLPLVSTAGAINSKSKKETGFEFSVNSISLDGLEFLIWQLNEQAEVSAHYIQVVHDLQERIKEQQVLHALNKILSTNNLPQEEILHKAANLLPFAFQYPTEVSVCIQIGDKTYNSEKFQLGAKKLSKNFSVAINIEGQLIAYYSDRISNNGHEMFIPEEDKLLESAATAIKNFIEARHNLDKLKKQEVEILSLIKNIGQPVFSTDENFHLKYANNMFFNWYRLAYKKTPEFSQSIFKYVPQEHKDILEELLTRKAFPAVLELDYEINGKTFNIEFFINPIVNEYNETPGFSFFVRDFTHKKTAEKDAEFKAFLLDNIGESVIATDLHGGITYWNKFAERLYGWEKKEVIGKNILDITPPQNMKKDSADIIRKIVQKGGWEGEIKLRKKGDEVFLAKVTDILATAPCGKPTAIVGISSDVTEKRMLEKLLFAEKQLLEMTTSNVPLNEQISYLLLQLEEISEKVKCSFFHVHPDGSKLIAGPSPSIPVNYKEQFREIKVEQGQTICGTAACKLEPLFVFDLEKEPLEAKMKNAAIASGFNSCLSFPILSSNENLLGILNCYYAQASDFNDFDRKMLERSKRLLAVIIEKIQIQKQKDKKEKLLEEISSTIGGVVYQFRITKDCKPYFKFISKGIEKLCGVKDTDIYTNFNCFLNQVHPSDVNRLKVTILNSAYEMSPWNMKFRLKNKEGEIRWYEGNAIPYLRRDKTISWNGTFFDITENEGIRLSLEEKNVQLCKANAELDRFIYSASHELRSPLASLLGVINLLKIDEDPEKYVTYFKWMEKSVANMDHTLRKIAEYTLNNKSDKEITEINFKEVLLHVTEPMLVNRVNIQQEVEIKHSVPFYSDERRIRLVLNNLVHNATTFIDPKKAIHTVSIKGKITDEKAIIMVSDNGVGIREDFMEKIFDMFFRGCENNSGTGMGLYVAREAAHKMSGILTAESVFGEGATFTLIFPNLKQ